MPLSKIEKILHDSMGLNSTSIGISAVLNAAELRMTALNISDLKKYSEIVTKDKNEVQELIEEIVVAETWFFRDIQPFKMLTEYIKDEWQKIDKDKPIRILSLPCATGEEPYSIAITLIEAGLMPSQLKIDAFDISERNIKRCKTACYRENSFRGVEKNIRDRFFNYNNKQYYPDILIKAMVNFEVASVLDPVFVATQIPYDIVFCRNLLIYFDKHTQATAAEMLDKLLNPKGMLFVGHAETSIFSKNWEISRRYPKSFIVRKFDDNQNVSNKLFKQKSISSFPQNVGNDNKKKLRTVIVESTKSERLKIDDTKIPFCTPVSNENHIHINLELKNELVAAKQFADNGQLIEAEKKCIKYLEKNKQDTKVYFLLAIIQLSIGDEQKSVQYFKNVIYLEPGHYDALIYLSTLLGDQGDELGATRFRERALRVKNKTNLKLDKA